MRDFAVEDVCDVPISEFMAASSKMLQFMHLVESEKRLAAIIVSLSLTVPFLGEDLRANLLAQEWGLSRSFSSRVELLKGYD